MEFRNLGNSGLRISVVGLGGNNFGWYIGEQESISVINAALDAGINFIDTADVYDNGTSEICVGKAVRGKRDRVIIATKFGNRMGKGPNERGGSRYYIMQAVEASLRRLQTDYIDLYQMHSPHPTTPLEETLRALDDLVRSGKVRYIGCSNFAGWQLGDALWTSRLLNLNSFITVQTRYNLLDREIEAELVPACQAHKIGVIPWGPLAGGFLTGKYRPGEKGPADGRLSNKMPTPIYEGLLNEANWAKLARWEEYAKARGHSMGELAIAWLLGKPWISTVIAGVKRPEQVAPNVAAAEWKLTPKEVAEVDALC